MGWIARDDNGCLIKVVALEYTDLTEIHCAEAISIREALSWIKQQMEGE